MNKVRNKVMNKRNTFTGINSAGEIILPECFVKINSADIDNGFLRFSQHFTMYDQDNGEARREFCKNK